VTNALDLAWAKIQALEPKVPDARWYLTSGRSSSCATGPWNTPDDLVLRINLKRPVYDTQGKPLLDEKGRPLLKNRSGRDLVGQLLHWAAHATHGISPGAEGRYHSQDFGDIAERLGLEVRNVPGTGYAPVTVKIQGHPVEKLSPKGQAQFRADITALDKAMKSWEPVAEDAARKRPRGPLAMVCSCVPARVIRVSSDPPRGALGPDIICSVCSKPFRLVPGQRKTEADRV
jgi:hypothetical protein